MKRPGLVVALAIVAAAAAAALWFGLPRGDGRAPAPAPSPETPVPGGGDPPPVTPPPPPPVPPDLPPADRARLCLTQVRLGQPDPGLCAEVLKDPEGRDTIRWALAEGLILADRAAALFVLAFGGDPGAEATIREAIAGTYGEELRGVAVVALARLPGDPAERATALLELVDGERGEEVAGAAYAELFAMGPDKAVDAAAGMLRRAARPEERRMAWALLAGVRRGPPHGDLPPSMLPFPAAHAEAWLCAPDGEASVAPLLAQAREETAPAARTLAFMLVSRLPGEGVDAAVTEMFAVAGPEERQAMVWSLTGEHGIRRFRELVPKASGLPDAPVRRAIAARALEAGDGDSLPALETWLAEERDAETRAALEATITALRGE